MSKDTNVAVKTRGRVVRVKDLVAQTGTPFPRPFLHCAVCGERFSADLGDYFAADPETVLRCCGEPMRLVTAKTVLTEVKR